MLASATPAVVAEQQELVDPVCGMTVDVAVARHVSEWQGQRFAFCAASCKRTFDADPDKYAEADASD